MAAEERGVNRERRDGPPRPEEANLEDRVLVDRFLRARELLARDPGAEREMESAFRMLTVRYQERIHKLVWGYTKDPLEAEDVTQEVFLKLFRKVASFQWDSAFYTWLYRIAVNTAMDYVGKRKRRPVKLSDDVGLLQDSAAAVPGAEPSSPDASLLERERAAITRQILTELPAQYRAVLVLREFEDLSYQEIAEVLGCSLGTVESRLFRARGHFRRILEDRYPDLLT